MRCLALIFTLLAAAFAAADAFAAGQPTMSAALLRTTWALLVVLGLILALYGLARKRLILGKTSGSAIKIIEMRPLMTKTTLALVEVRGRELLLGISANGIHCLADLSGQEKTAPPPSDFEALLTAQQ